MTDDKFAIVMYDDTKIVFEDDGTTKVTCFNKIGLEIDEIHLTRSDKLRLIKWLLNTLD